MDNNEAQVAVEAGAQGPTRGMQDPAPAAASPRRAIGRGGLARTLLLVFLPLILGLLILAGFLGAVSAVQAAESRTVERLDLVANLKERDVNNWLVERDRDLAVLAGDRAIRQDVSRFQEAGSDDAQQRAAYLALGIRLKDFLDRKVPFSELFLLDAGSGQVIVSTDVLREGVLHDQADYFQEGLKTSYIQPLQYDPQVEVASIIMARPVFDQDGKTVAVLVGRATMGDLTVLMQMRTGLGDTGETYLVNRDYLAVTGLRFGQPGQTIDSEGARLAVEQYQYGLDLYRNYQGTAVYGNHRWVPKLQVALLAEMSQAEVQASRRTVLLSVGGLLVVGGVLAAGVVVYVSRRITRPITELTEAAAEMAAGDLSRRVVVDRADEIGSLSQAFDAMADQLEDSITTLEQRIADRTQDLERRTRYLAATTQVGRAVAVILETDQLIQDVVKLIREQFDLYYVGLFLVDEVREWAVLQAGTGEAGQAMLARRHRIRIGEGMIGWSVEHAESRVALDVGEDAVRLATAELPETRSEAALPLRSRGQVLGALTVQHTRAGAFDEDTVAVLQTMADQVAVAIDNAQLFQQAEEALAAERRVYGEISAEAWEELLRARPGLGYRCDEQGTSPVGMSEMREPGQDSSGQQELVLPIRIQDRVLGTFVAHRADGREEWTEDEMALIEALNDQLSLALESARLYGETRRRAFQDRMLGEITSRIRETLEVETVLQTAIRELGEAMGMAEVEVRMGSSQTRGSPGDGRDGSEAETS